MFGQQVPVEPARIIVLAVGVIVAALTAPHLITHNKHGHTHRTTCGCEEVLHLPVAKALNCGIVRRTFEAAVPASVVVTSIAVVFAILFVVLVVIGDDVVQGKTVVTCNEIDAFLELRALSGRKCSGCQADGQPCAPTESFAPRKKSRISSRNRSFHSFQLSPTKLPT